MANLSEKNLVVHSNDFGNVVDKKMTVVEQKILAIYISKLNPKDKSTRKVCFSLADYQKIMNIKRFNLTRIKACAEKIISTPVCIDQPDGGFITCHIFSSFGLKKINGEWTVELDCSDAVLPYLFDLNKRFFQYELWNVLRLNEINHHQLYKQLKQFEKIGERTMSLEELKQCFGLKNQYQKFHEFNRRVIQGCQKALKENTDICFEYEPIRQGRRVDSIKFTVYKNDDYDPQMSIFDMPGKTKVENVEEFEPFEYSNERLAFLAGACDSEFSEEQMLVLWNLIIEKLPAGGVESHNLALERFHYLKKKYDEMNMRKPEKSRFGYLKKLLEADLNGESKQVGAACDNAEIEDKYAKNINKFD